MCADKLDKDGLSTVEYCDNQAIVVTLDIEDDPIITKNAGTRKVGF